MSQQHGPTIDFSKVAQVLVDASEVGDRLAAKQNGLSVRTIERYRLKYSHAPHVAELVASLKKKLVEEWLIRAKEVRVKLLTKVAYLAMNSENLREIAGAFKIVHDAILAEELVTEQLPSSIQGRITATPPKLQTPHSTH